MNKPQTTSWQTFLNIWFEDIVFEDGKAWAFAGNFNMLLEIDLDKELVKTLTSIPWEDRQKERLYAGIEKYKELLILIPMAAKDIVIYNLETNNLTQIFMPEPFDHNIDERHKFFAHCIIDNCCFIFGQEYAEIICLNLDDYSVIRSNDWVNELMGRGSYSNHGYFMKDLVVRNKIIVIPSSKNNSIFLVNSQTLETKIKYVGSKGTCYSGICFDGEDFWIMGCCGKKNYVVRWNADTDNTEEIALPVSGWYINALCVDGKVVFYPYSKESPVLTIELNSPKIEKLDIGKGFRFAKQQHSKIYTMSIDEGRLCCMDAVRKKSFSLTYDEEIISMYADIWGERFMEHAIMVEEKKCDFELYCRMNPMTHDENKNFYDSGKQIHSYCTSHLR